MRVKYFKDTDTALLEFSTNSVEETREVSENVYVDLDQDGNLVSMTIEHAARNAALPSVQIQEIDDNGEEDAEKRVVREAPDDPVSLRIESSPRSYGLLEASDPYRANIDGWIVREEYVADAREDIRPGLGTYQVILERDVGTSEELSNSYSTGLELAEQIELLWLYATGTTLHGSGFVLSLVPEGPPPHWTSNIDDVRQSIDAREYGITYESFSIESRHWRFGYRLPLRQVLEVREKYLAAEDLIRSLIELHAHAHTSRGFHESAFFLAKALEIVRRILPGKRFKNKALHLPREIRDHMALDLRNLYELSNERFDTRHAIRKGKLALHPRMHGKELLDFLKTADVVVRSVVCKQLGVDQVPVAEGDPPRE